MTQEFCVISRESATSKYSMVGHDPLSLTDAQSIATDSGDPANCLIVRYDKAPFMLNKLNSPQTASLSVIDESLESIERRISLIIKHYMTTHNYKDAVDVFVGRESYEVQITINKEKN